MEDSIKIHLSFFTKSNWRSLSLTFLEFLRFTICLLVSALGELYNISNNRGSNFPVWLNGWVFVYELSGCGFESSCSHLNFRFCACFEQGVSWHSGNYRVWIHSQRRAWHDKNMQLLFVFLIYYKVVIYLKYCAPHPAWKLVKIR